jgi:hypothetical protein
VWSWGGSRAAEAARWARPARPLGTTCLSNEVLNSYKARHSGEEGGRFDNDVVIAARDAYSDYLLRELDDEIAKHVPDYREYLEVLKSIGNIQFTSRVFADAWAGRPTLADGSWEAGLAALFEFSVIGYLKSGEAAEAARTSGGIWMHVLGSIPPRTSTESTLASRRRWTSSRVARGPAEAYPAA